MDSLNNKDTLWGSCSTFPRGEIDKKLEKLKTVEGELTNKEQELLEVGIL